MNNPIGSEFDEDLSSVWAARLELRLKRNTPEYIKGYRGAYTTVLVRCESAKQFISEATEHVEREGFDIYGIETLFPLSAGQFEISESIRGLVERTNEYHVQWTTFHLFKDDA